MSERKKRPWHEGQRLIRVDFKTGDTGLIYGTSRDLPGLLVAEPTLELAVERAPDVIRDMYLANGKEIKRCLIVGKHSNPAAVQSGRVWNRSPVPNVVREAWGSVLIEETCHEALAFKEPTEFINDRLTPADLPARSAVISVVSSP